MKNHSDSVSYISNVIGLRRDFHELRSEEVDLILIEAKKNKYYKPKNANGSRARYYYAYLQRLSARD